MDTEAPNHPIDTQTAAEALADAAATAGYAPSIHNTQPWRWRLTGNTIDLHLVRSRVPPISDPDGRLATLSCGAALHHARIAMAAHGWRITVERMLQDGDRDLLARIQVRNRSPVDPASATLLRTVPLRQTDERPMVAGAPIGPEALTAITAAVEAHDTGLYTPRPDQLAELAAAADDRAAEFVILHGPADEPLNWLRAGEALSGGWLTATRHAVSVQPHSAPMETTATRRALRAMIAGTGYPYLVLGLGMAGAGPPRTPRLPAVQIIERY
jgi:nitroreductase